MEPCTHHGLTPPCTNQILKSKIKKVFYAIDDIDIRSAKKSIDIPVFFLTHNKLSKELVKSHKKGVKIRMILDATAATNGYSKHNYLKHNIQEPSIFIKWIRPDLNN